MEPAFGRDAARFALALAHLRTVLGDHHDDVVTSKLRDLAAPAGRDSDAFAFADLATPDDFNRTREAHYRKALSQASDSKRVLAGPAAWPAHTKEQVIGR